MSFKEVFKPKKFNGRLYYKDTNKLFYEGELKKGKWKFGFTDIKGYGTPDGIGKLYRYKYNEYDGQVYEFKDGRIGGFNVNGEIIFTDDSVMYKFINNIIEKGISWKCEEVYIEFDKEENEGVTLRKSKILLELHKENKKEVVLRKNLNEENIEFTKHFLIEAEYYDNVINFFKNILVGHEKDVEKQVKFLEVSKDKIVTITLLDGEEKDKINIKFC